MLSLVYSSALAAGRLKRQTFISPQSWRSEIRAGQAPAGAAGRCGARETPWRAAPSLARSIPHRARHRHAETGHLPFLCVTGSCVPSGLGPCRGGRVSVGRTLKGFEGRERRGRGQRCCGAWGSQVPALLPSGWKCGLSGLPPPLRLNTNSKNGRFLIKRASSKMKTARCPALRGGEYSPCPLPHPAVYPLAAWPPQHLLARALSHTSPGPPPITWLVRDQPPSSLLARVFPSIHSF